MTGVILRGKALVYLNMIRRTRGRHLMRILLLGLLSLFIIGFAYFLAVQLFFGLSVVLPELGKIFIGLIFAGIMIFLLLTGISTVLFQLYLSSDLMLLMAAPVPLRSIWVSKMLESLVGTGLPALAGLMGLVAYGQAVSAPVWYYPLAVIVLAAVLAMVTALNSLIVMAVMRFVSPKRARGAVTVIGALFGAGVWATWMIYSGRIDELENIGNSINTLRPQIEAIWQSLQITPPGWAANAIVALVAGDWLAFLSSGVLLFGLSAGLLMVSYAVFSRAFYQGWLGSREEGSKPIAAAQHGRSRPLESILSPLPVDVRSMVIKDWRITGRDMRNLSRLIFPIVAAFIFTYMISTSTNSNQVGELAFWSAPGMLAILVPYMFCSSMGLRAVAIEGHSFRFIRSTPLSTNTFLFAKILYTFIPVVILTAVISIAAAVIKNGNLLQVIIVLGIAIWFTTGLTVIGVGSGAIDPRFDVADPRKQVGWAATLAWFIGSTVFLLGCVALFAWGAALITPGLVPDVITGSSLLVTAITGAALVLFGLGIGVAILIMMRGAANLDRWQIAE